MRILDSPIRRAGAVLIALFVLAILGWIHAIGWHPSTKTYPIQGIDVSERQGEVDWNTLNAGGADFAYLGATIGADRRDARFAANWQGVDAAGMRRGAVHLWSFCQSAVAQADNFITTVPRDKDALPALLAIEFTADCDTRPAPVTAIDDIKRFLVMVETHTGKPMLLKIARPVEDVYQLSAAIPRPVWETRNFLSPNYAARPWTMWQASDMRRIDGVAGPIHWDVVTP